MRVEEQFSQVPFQLHSLNQVECVYGCALQSYAVHFHLFLQ